MHQGHGVAPLQAMKPETEKLCDFLGHLQNGEIGDKEALASLSTLAAHIRQSVQEIDRNVVVGEKTTDRIQNGLSEQLSEVRVAVGDTNLVVNVNCGDPIYHIKFNVADGNVSDLTVGLTPVCR